MTAAVVDTNLKGVFFITQAIAQGMLARGRGSIVNICSLTSFVGVPTATPYGASKSGLLGLTRALSAEWGGRNLQMMGLSTISELKERRFQEDVVVPC